MTFFSVSDTGKLEKKSEFSQQESNLRPSDYVVRITSLDAQRVTYARWNKCGGILGVL